MKMDKFERLLTTYGANFDRWPDRDAADARTFLESSDAARALYAEAEAFDGILDTLGKDAMTADMSDRILAATRAPETNDVSAYDYRAPALKLAMSAAASLAIGISVGLTDLGRSEFVAESDAVSVAFGLADDYEDDTFDGEEL